MIPRTPWSTLFPYTTLFRSAGGRLRCPERRRGGFGGRLRHHGRSEEHTSELQSQSNLVCRLLLEKKKCIAGWEPTAAKFTDSLCSRNSAKKFRREAGCRDSVYT